MNSTRNGEPALHQATLVGGAGLGAIVGACTGALVKGLSLYVFGAAGAGPGTAAICMAAYGLLVGALWARLRGPAWGWRPGAYIGAVTGLIGGNLLGLVAGLLFGAVWGRVLEGPGSRFAGTMRDRLGPQRTQSLVTLGVHAVVGAGVGGLVGLLVMFIVVSNDGWFALQFSHLAGDIEGGKWMVELVSGSKGLGAGLCAMALGMLLAPCWTWVRTRPHTAQGG